MKYDSASCAIMGIRNITPDSISDGGEHATYETARSYAVRSNIEGIKSARLCCAELSPSHIPHIVIYSRLVTVVFGVRA